MKPLVFAFLAGLLGACGFAPWDVWPLTLAAFAFLLWLIETAPSLRSALARGYWFGVGNFVLGLNWIATAFTYQAAMPAWLGWIAVVLLSFYLAVYPAMAAGLAWRHAVRSSRAKALLSEAEGSSGAGTEAGAAPLNYARDERWRLVLILAAAWLATEWLRATMFTGFAWNPIGVVLIDSWLKWPATVVGTYGLSAVVILLAGLAYAAWQLAGWRRYAALVALVLIAAIDPHLVSKADEAKLAAQPALRIVQPNIGQQDKWREGFEERNFALLQRLSATRAEGPRLLLWPEAAVTDPLQDGRVHALHQRQTAKLQGEVARLLAPGDLLLTGGITYQSADGVNVTSATNSVFVMDAAGRILGRYDKSHLVPYGEYLPMRPILSAIGLSRLAPGDVDFDSGPGPLTFPLPRIGRVGFQLCYEIIFSGKVVQDGARPDFIFNPSNDAWFGAWGPPQHLAQARLRALEEGLPILRSTPTGISAIIDADARLLQSLPWRTAGAIDGRLPLPKPPTLFARLGNVAPFLFGLALVLAAIAARRKAR